MRTSGPPSRVTSAPPHEDSDLLAALRTLSAGNVSLWVDECDAREVSATPLRDAGEHVGARLVPPRAPWSRYTSELERLADRGGFSPLAALETLVFLDLREVARGLRRRPPAHGEQEVILEVRCPPQLASNAQRLAAFADATQLIGRETRGVIPAMCLPDDENALEAVEDLTSRGISTTIDGVITSSSRGALADAYIRGLERRLAEGLPLSGIRSITWTPVTPLERRSAAALPTDSPLVGFVATAAAQRIYLDTTRTFAGRRWRPLVAGGAAPQQAGFRDFSGSPHAIRELALPGSVLALTAGDLEVARLRRPVSQSECDETEIEWVLVQAQDAGLRLKLVETEVHEAIRQRALFSQRAALTAITSALDANRSLEACG